MAFGFSFVSLDADKAEPLIIIAVAAVAGWWLYNKAQSQAQANAAAQSASSATQQYISGVENAALLASLGGSGGGSVVSQQPTYSGPVKTAPAPAMSQGGTAVTNGAA